MKRIPALALFTLAASLTASVTAPSATAQGTVLKANIPFYFNAGETDLPPGEYTISEIYDGVVHIQNTRNDASATIVALKGHHEPEKGNVLVFERYGSQYFLHRILSPTVAQMNVDVPGTKLEAHARRREAKLEMPEEILIATR
jgi:hypothetical protein